MASPAKPALLMLLLLVALAACAGARRVIVELADGPAATPGADEPAVQRRAAQILDVQDRLLTRLRSVGFSVSRVRTESGAIDDARFSRLINAVSVDIEDESVEKASAYLRRLPGVVGVTSEHAATQVGAEPRAMTAEEAAAELLVAKRLAQEASSKAAAKAKRQDEGVPIDISQFIEGSYFAKMRVPELWDALQLNSKSAGQNIKVAVLSDGLHVASPSFKTSFGWPVKVPAPGFGETDNCNGKIVASRAYFRPADEPLDEAEGHTWPGPRLGGSTGIAVASVIAGEPTIGPLYNNIAELVSGVAPGAWLMNYRVFYYSKSGRVVAYDTEILKALEDAFIDGADIIVLPFELNVPAANRNHPLHKALRVLTDNGRIVVTMGGDQGYEFGTVTASEPSVITVGASASKYLLSRLITYVVDGKLHSEEGLTGYTSHPFFTPKLIEIVNPPSFTADGIIACNEADYNGVMDFYEGKAAMIKRGICPFQQKIEHAVEHNAGFVIIFNREGTAEGEIFTMLGRPATYPRVGTMFISYINGTTIYNFNKNNKTVSAVIIESHTYYDTGDQEGLRYFSSCGPNGDGNLSPDLMAPGLEIFVAGGYTTETLITNEEAPFGYSYFSSSAASAGFVAGAAALLKQQFPTRKPSEIKSALVISAGYINVADLLDNSAPTPNQYGAGRLDVFKAFESDIIVEPPVLNFGSLKNGETKAITFTVKPLEDIGHMNLVVDKSNVVITPEFIMGEKDKVYLFTANFTGSGAGRVYDRVEFNMSTGESYYIYASAYLTSDTAKDVLAYDISFAGCDGNEAEPVKAPVYNEALTNANLDFISIEDFRCFPFNSNPSYLEYTYESRLFLFYGGDLAVPGLHYKFDMFISSKMAQGAGVVVMGKAVDQSFQSARVARPVTETLFNVEVGELVSVKDILFFNGVDTYTYTFNTSVMLKKLKTTAMSTVIAHDADGNVFGVATALRSKNAVYNAPAIYLSFGLEDITAEYQSHFIRRLYNLTQATFEVQESSSGQASASAVSSDHTVESWNPPDPEEPPSEEPVVVSSSEKPENKTSSAKQSSTVESWNSARSLGCSVALLVLSALLAAF